MATVKCHLAARWKTACGCFEVVDGVTTFARIASAVRLSPHGNLGGRSDTVPHFSHIIWRAWQTPPRASSVGFADDACVDSADNASLFRHLLNGRMITGGGYTT
jgi:hypothetical protein